VLTVAVRLSRWRWAWMETSVRGTGTAVTACKASEIRGFAWRDRMWQSRLVPSLIGCVLTACGVIGQS